MLDECFEVPLVLLRYMGAGSGALGWRCCSLPATLGVGGVWGAPASGVDEVDDAARAREPCPNKLVAGVDAADLGDVATGRVVSDYVTRTIEAPYHQKVPVAPR
jgi:hypothetical protein